MPPTRNFNTSHVSINLICSLLKLPISEFQYILSLIHILNYVNSISDLLSNGILNTITDLCNLVFIIVFMLILNVRLTLVCLCGLPILAIVIVVIKKKQRTAWQVQSNKQSLSLIHI